MSQTSYNYTLSAAISTGIQLEYDGLKDPQYSPRYASPLTITQAGTVGGFATLSQFGVYSSGNPSTLLNYGIIKDGIYFRDGGTVTNAGAGSIGGEILLRSGTVTNTGRGASIENVRFQYTGSLHNSGTIGAVELQGGTITNSGAGAFIGNVEVLASNGDPSISNAATMGGVYLAINGTVINSGTINGAVVFGAFGATVTNRLMVDPGAVFNGAITVSSDPFANASLSETLEFASGVFAGTLTGIGTQFTGFNTLAIDPGASWLLSGDSAGLATGQTIIGFAPGDTIDLTDFAATGRFISSTQIWLSNATATVTLDLPGILSVPVLIQNDGSAGTEIIGVAQGHSLSSTVSHGIVVGYYEFQTGRAPFLSPFTVTQTGTVNAPTSNGVYADGGTLTNDGLINATGGDGINFRDGGIVTNAGAGRINGDFAGIQLRYGTVSNIGQSAVIKGQQFGIDTQLNGVFFNSGTIGGASAGIFSGGAGYVSNDGAGALISGREGINVTGNSTILNAATITGTRAGVYFTGSGTVINSGTISGGTYSVLFDQFAGASNQNRLILDPGAVMTGRAEGLDAANGTLNSETLEFASGASTGTLTGIGTQFLGFNTIVIDTGAAWLLAGDSAGLATGQTIAGFATGDTLDVTDFAATHDSYVSGRGLVLSNATTSETLDLTGITGPAFIHADGNAGTDISLCYLRGTRILSQKGEVNVEDICIGDHVATRFGGLRPVKWIGRQRYDRRFIARNRNKIPVRIHAGALAPALPMRDLLVSPGHSMLIGDTLVLAHALVNGITITQNVNDPVMPKVIDYFHLEFDAHDCVLAEGAWSEAFADGPGLRAPYDNAAEFQALYPEAPAPARISLCAPRPESGPALDLVLRPIVARAAAGLRRGPLEGFIDVIDENHVAGWARDLSHPELPVLLEVWAGGQLAGSLLACDGRADLEAAGKGNGRCAFTFHAAAPLSPDPLRHVCVLRADGGEALPLTDAGKSKQSLS